MYRKFVILILKVFLPHSVITSSLINVPHMEYNFYYLHVFLVPFSITRIDNPFQEETNKLRSQNLKNSVNSLNFNFSFYEGFELLISTLLHLISFLDVLLLQISQNVSIFSSLKRSKLTFRRMENGKLFILLKLSMPSHPSKIPNPPLAIKTRKSSQPHEP